MTNSYNTSDHFFHKDFTKHEETLSKFITGDFIKADELGRTFCDILNEMDVENSCIWNVGALRSDWNLLGARIMYNGVNRREMLSKGNYMYLLVFVLPEDITPRGRFVLHYNIVPQFPDVA